MSTGRWRTSQRCLNRYVPLHSAEPIAIGSVVGWHVLIGTYLCIVQNKLIDIIYFEKYCLNRYVPLHSAEPEALGIDESNMGLNRYVPLHSAEPTEPCVWWHITYVLIGTYLCIVQNRL